MKKITLGLLFMGLLIYSAEAQSIMFERQIQKTGTTDGVDESTDDAEQVNNEMDKLFDDDLDMGWEGDDFNIVSTGLRFTNVTIPAGAKIDSAFIVIYSHEEEKDTAKVTIYGEASNNPETYSLEGLILTRPKTTKMVKWEITETWPIWTMFRTPDIAPIIQEIVDLQGWQSGNALALMLTGEDQGASEKDNARDFESFENEEDPDDGGDGKNHPERAPKLVVYYTQSSASTDKVKELAFSVYPNPAQNTFHISRKLDNNTNIQLVNAAGQTVKSFKSNQSEYSIDGVPAGFYYIKAVRGEYSFSQKLIIK
jgi:hypothetical protein